MSRPQTGAIEWARLTDYVTEMQRLFGVERWHIVIVEGEQPEDEKDAEIEQSVAVNHEASDWRIGDSFFELDADEQRLTIVHEIIHLFTYHVQSDAMDAMESRMTRYEFEAMRGVLMRGYERSTDRLAYAIAEHFPLPSIIEPVDAGEAEEEGS